MSARRLILLTGGSGQIGSAIKRVAQRSDIDLVAPDSSQLDLCDEKSIVDAVRSRGWTGVINCAAYTAVDKAETHVEQAYMVNSTAPGILARETERIGVPIIHLSTDYVFDGTKSSPYIENDAVNPLSVYGKSKENGEAEIRNHNPRHAIMRTAWVLSASAPNFLNTMLRLAKDRPEVRVVDDQIGCPSAAQDIANAVLQVVDGLGSRSGTWHFVNQGETSWFGLAAHIFAVTKAKGFQVPALRAIPTSEYPTAAKRPANSRLATTSIAQDFDIAFRHWRDAVDEILSDRLKH